MTDDDDQWFEFDEVLGAHTLNGHLLTEHELLEVQLEDGTWVSGRFEVRSGTKRRATLRVFMAGITRCHWSLLHLPDFAVLARRPGVKSKDAA